MEGVRWEVSASSTPASHGKYPTSGDTLHPKLDLHPRRRLGALSPSGLPDVGHSVIQQTSWDGYPELAPGLQCCLGHRLKF